MQRAKPTHKRRKPWLSAALSALVVLAWLRPLAAEPRAPDTDPAATPELSTQRVLSEYYQNELSFKLGLWGFDVIREGATVPLGLFGEGYPQVFSGSPRAIDSMKTFRQLKLAGVTARVVGLVTAAVPLVLFLWGSDAVFQEGTHTLKPLYGGLAIAGTTVGIAGGVVTLWANGFLSDAVVQYNEDLYRRLLGRPPQALSTRAVLGVQIAIR